MEKRRREIMMIKLIFFPCDTSEKICVGRLRKRREERVELPVDSVFHSWVFCFLFSRHFFSDFFKKKKREVHVILEEFKNIAGIFESFTHSELPRVAEREKCRLRRRIEKK